MKRDEYTGGETPPPIQAKPKRSAGVPVLSMHDIKIPTDTEETKQLGSIVKLLKEKNNLTKGTDITVIAAKTIKAVELAQKGGSDSFKREATKSLINLREVVSKSVVISDKRIKTLLDRFDAVSLDAKNASFYLLENAKARAGDIHSATKVSAKDATVESKAKAKLIVSAAETTAKETKQKASIKAGEIVSVAEVNAKSITQKARTKATDLIIEGNVYIKEKKLSANTSIIKKKKEADENIKVKINKANYDASEIIKAANDSKQQVKLEKFKAMSDLYTEKAKNKLANEAQKETNRAHLRDRREKQNDIVRDRLTYIRDAKEAHLAKMKVIESEAKSNVKSRASELKSQEKLKRTKESESAKIIKNKKDKRDERSEKFNASVMEGVYDANPLIKAGVNIFGGVSSGIGRALDWNKERKANKLASPQLNPVKVDQSTPSIIRSAIDSSKLQRVNSTGTTVLANPKTGPIAANDAQAKPASIVRVMVTSFLKVIDKISTITKFLIQAAKQLLIGTKSKSFSDKGYSIGDSASKTKPSLLQRSKKKLSSIMQPKATKGIGIPSGGAGAIGEVGAGLGEAAGAGLAEAGAGVAVEAGVAALAAGGAVVAGLAATAELWVPVLAAVAGVTGLVMLTKSFFGKSDSSKSARDVSGTITTGGSSGDWKDSVAASDKPSQYDRIVSRQSVIDDMTEASAADSRAKNAGGGISVNTDNSVRSSNTTIIQEKLTTRNDDVIYQRFGYGVVAA